MRKRIALFISMLLLMSSTMVFGQSKGWLEVDEPQIGGELVQVGFKIPYEGMLEIRIFDDTGALVWRNQELRMPGEGIVRLKTSAFKAGKTYILQLNYKKEEVRKTVAVPG